MARASEIHEQELQQILESARRLGVELDEADALQWLAAMTAAQHEEVVFDVHSGSHFVSLDGVAYNEW